MPKLIWTAESLRNRIQWVLDNRSAVVGDATNWAMRAGLNRGHIGNIQQHLDRLAEKPNYSLECRTAWLLAHVAEVPAGWFAFGEGTQFDVSRTIVTKYPNLTVALNMARLAEPEILRATVDTLASLDLNLPADLSVLEWFEQIRHADRVARAERDRQHKEIAEAIDPPAQLTQPASSSYKTVKGVGKDP